MRAWGHFANVDQEEAVMIGYTPQGAYNIPNSRAACDLGLADRPGSEDFLIELPGLIKLHLAAASF